MQTTNQLITLPKESLDKLRCSLCKEYLSVPPVDLTRNVCGRCNTSKVGCAAYEVIARYVLFPCTYLKCNEKIAWGKVEEHERKCVHNTFMCPVENCTAVYEMSLTSTHFLASHKSLLFHEGPLKIKPTNNMTKNKQVFLIDGGEQLLLVFAYGVPENIHGYNTNQYYFGVFALNSDFDNNTKFEVTLTTYINSKLVSYTQKNQNVLPFDKRDHCFKCIDYPKQVNYSNLSYGQYGGRSNRTNNCTAAYYHKKGNDFLSVNFDGVDMRNCENSSYEIDIKYSEENNENADINELSKKMECPICTRYMVSPIYICDTGHSLCKDCRRQLSACPYCRARIGNKRNFFLEE